MEKTETNNVREGSTFASIKNSLGSPSIIYNPESQLLSEMIKDNSTLHSKRSSMSSFLDDNQNQDHDINKIIYTNPFSNNIVEELSAELNRNFLLDSEDESNAEENSKDVNELLLFKRKSNQKAPDSTISEIDTQSSVYTDNENQTETQSEYSVTSSRDYKIDNEPLKDRIWYYRKPPMSNQNFSHDINNQIDDNQSYSDDSSTIDDSTAAIMQLKLHHYVSTNNLKVKKDNRIVKRRTTISYSRFKPKLNTNFDFTHDINDIPLFSNKEFKTEAKENYHVADSAFDDFNTSVLLNRTGDASRKRRSQINQRSRTFSQAIVNENISTLSPPLSSTSFMKENVNNNSFSNISNSNKKQLHLNNPMDSSHIIKTENIDTNNNEKESQMNETGDNSNQLFKVLMMAKDHILSLGGKIKRTDSIRSTASKRSSIRKNQKKLKRHSTRRRNRNSLRNHKNNLSIPQNISLHEQSEDEMTTVSSTTDPDKSTVSHSSILKKKSSNPGYLKTISRKSSGPISRNSSLISSNTKRSSLYSKNRIYQNDLSINYSASNLSESSAGVEIDDTKKYDESFDLDVQNNSKNDKLRVYGVCPESYYSEYHEPVASSVDGRSSLYDYEEEEEESVVSESDNVFSSYTTGGDVLNDLDEIRNKLNMMPLTEEPSKESNTKNSINQINKNKNNMKDKFEVKEKANKKGVKKIISSSTIETNISSESLTPTITNSNVNHLNNDNTEIKSEYTADKTTIAGSTYGGDKSNATIIPRMGNNNNNNYDALYNFAGIKRNWDEETDSTYSRFNENERHPLEIASMPDGIRESNNYQTIKQIPLPYYRYGVYMYITDPVIVQTRTMMERMFSAHTLYTITVKLLRPNLPMYRNDSICTFTVHKRYRQFRSFYKEIHKKYKDTINDWPEFPKKTFFDRFDSDTIKNRAFAFSSLMSFISLHPLLYNCPVLLTFLEITGTMNNPLSNINSNISKRQGSMEKSGLPFEGKTIQFEGRNVAPSIPKIFGSLGRRQYPPGFYGQFPPGQPQSYYDQSMSYNNNNNLMQLKRRSMYGKIESNYYNPDYYSSFSRPQLSKMRTTEFLKNRNSLYSTLSATEIERIGKNDSVSSVANKSVKEVVRQSSPKLSPLDLKKNIKNNLHSGLKESIKPQLDDTVSNDKSKVTNEKVQQQQQQQELIDKKLITSSTTSPSSSNAPTPKLIHNTPIIESQKSKNNNLEDNSLSTPTSSASTLKTNTPTSTINNNINISENISQNKKSEIPNNINNNNNTNIPKQILNKNSKDNTDNTNINTIDVTQKGSSPTSSTSNSSDSTAKGKDIAKTDNKNEDISSTVVPRPRPRPRPRNPVVYRNMDEMDLNFMPVSRYNHYQQIKEIPGFQYLISEFPKLRSTQNKRYSSIF